MSGCEKRLLQDCAFCGHPCLFCVCTFPTFFAQTFYFHKLRNCIIGDRIGEEIICRHLYILWSLAIHFIYSVTSLRFLRDCLLTCRRKRTSPSCSSEEMVKLQESKSTGNEDEEKKENLEQQAPLHYTEISPLSPCEHPKLRNLRPLFRHIDCNTSIFDACSHLVSSLSLSLLLSCFSH